MYSTIKFTLSRVQTDATLLVNNSNIVGSCCVRLCVAKSLTGFKRCYKQTQHVTSSKVGSCWPTMLRPFARGFRAHSCDLKERLSDLRENYLQTVREWTKSNIELIASYVHLKTGNHVRSHLKAIMALDHHRLIRSGKKSGRFFCIIFHRFTLKNLANKSRCV